MRKHRLYRRAAKRGHAIPFAADDPNAPANRPRQHHERLEKNLGRCRDLLQSQRVAEGLQKLNALATATNSPKRKAQILALAGDAEFRQGHFDNAINAYRAAAQLVVNDPRAWVRPAIAEVRALLKAARVDEASAVATQTWNRSYAQHEELQRQQAIQQAHIQHRKILIKQRPHRASVVASRLGYLFLNEGEPIQARESFMRAVTVNPQGGSRARHGLSIVALAENNFAEAESRAREALLLGKFQGKTVGVWETLIAARQRAGKTGIDTDLLAGVQSSRSSTVRARSTLAMVRGLRAHHDPAWENIANQWLTAEGATHPTVAAEIRKLMNSRFRLAADDPAAQAVQAAQLLSAPQLLSRNEYIATAKQFVRASLSAAQPVALDPIIRRAVALYGNAARDQLSHSLALACMMARRHDLARPLLQAVVARSARNAQFAKSLWALARMESSLGNYLAAAGLYDRFASDASAPVRHRLQATIKALQARIASGDAGSVDSIKDSLSAILAGESDFDILLDFARQLTHAPPAFHGLAAGLFSQGQAIARNQFASAQNPSLAINILFRLTRREVYDFNKFGDAVATWNSLSQQKRDWLWSSKSEFWEYIGWIFTAMSNIHLDADAQQLSATYLNDSATPTEGRLRIMSVIAQANLKRRRYADAISVFRTMIALAPEHRLCAEGYYWLALAAKKAGRDEQCIQYAKKIQVAQGSHVGLLSEWELDCKAILFRSNLVVGSLLHPARYDLRFQTKCLVQIHRHLARI